MSVMDPIQLGALSLTPSGFHGDKVAIRLEQDGPSVDGETATLSIVQDLRDKDTIPAAPMTAGDTMPMTCVPLLEIRTWETLQEVAAWIEAARRQQAPVAQ